MADNQLVIVAGGSGSRMGKAIPKQDLLINGTPMLVHTIRAFEGFIDPSHTVIVLPAAHMDDWNAIVEDHGLSGEIKTVAGGETRFHSVVNGLKLLNADGIIGIHDAARPCVSPELITRCYATALDKGSAVPVVEPGDSMRMIKDDGSKVVSRNDYRLVQTPQCFRAAELLQAYEQSYLPEFTDDAAVMEHAGTAIHLVESSGTNFKITRPDDLIRAEALLKNANK